MVFGIINSTKHVDELIDNLCDKFVDKFCKMSEGSQNMILTFVVLAGMISVFGDLVVKLIHV